MECHSSWQVQKLWSIVIDISEKNSDFLYRIRSVMIHTISSPDEEYEWFICGS